MSDLPESRERLFELLADEASGEPIAVAERAEFERLLADHPDVEADSFERAAAALHLALLGPHMEAMPSDLRDRVLRQARTHLGDGAPAPITPPRGRLLIGPWTGWIAAAAALLFALTRGPAAPVDMTLTYEEVASVAGSVQADWTPTEDEGGAGVSGEVVWDSASQTGYMRFRGLGVNDPTEGQYQLWIFDKDRPAEHPVDGGVFDSTGGDILVPIDAKIAVAEPTLFAITYERPGGVVVSSRERLLLTASPQ